jgi:hypothetical protein
MNGYDLQQRLLEAEAKLSQAVERLHALRRAALYGSYDPLEFDRAVMAYREAEAEAQHAREAWTQWEERASPAGGGMPVGRFAPESLAPEPTPRMRFVKWLVETGRLTEWPAEEADATPQADAPRAA